MRVYKTMRELVGNTPLLELTHLERAAGAQATVLAKLECMNPAGSAKDRPACEMLDEAERQGKLAHGATVIEPTSGNTGVGLAAACAARGYHAVCVMPDSMSVERRALLAAYGAEVVLTPGAQGMRGAIEKAAALAKETPGSFVPGQFVNPANPAAHYKTTGPEIWRDTDGAVDVFVATVGTGGTLSGAGRYLKEQNPAVRVVAVEPAGSPVLSGGKAGPHKIQGIGAGFVPDTLDTSVFDEVLTVRDEDAMETARAVARREGVLVGISSGAAAYAALTLACRAENAGKTIVALLTDTGERYLSTELFSGK